MSLSPASDGSSVIEDLSFEYVFDEDGNYIRMSKGSSKSNHSTPPTPSDSIPNSPSPNNLLKPIATEPIILNSPARRGSLSRSESAFPILQSNGRSFQRVTSGPPRRVARHTLEDQSQPRRAEDLKAKLAASAQFYAQYEEKENIHRLSLDVPSIQEMYGESPIAPSISVSAPKHQQPPQLRLPSTSTRVSTGKPIRVLKGTGVPKVDRISENEPQVYEDTDVEEEIPRYSGPQRVALAQSGSGRPRRSASLSDALSVEDHHHDQPDVGHRQQSHSRPGTSLGLRRESDDHEGRPRQSPSPTNGLHPPSRPIYAHKRRDSDTLRNAAPAGSPTVLYDQHAVPARMSPSAKGLAVSVKHRRSPTAPEPSVLHQSAAAAAPVRKTWGSSERNSLEAPALPERKERDRERPERPRSTHPPEAQAQPPPPPTASNVSVISSISANSSTSETQPSRPDRQFFVVNKKAYARMDLIGKGGSSRVYRVLTNANEIYAIKRVALDKVDQETMAGYMNEIALLKRLDGNSRIIRLVDSELRPGPGGTKGSLLLVMECGEVDLARLLTERSGEGVDMCWIAYYWQQMLQAVHVIHEEKIVHSDLKPANFVLVKGQLKLIDFGIANAIANDTTNIQRDHQMGTLNYMSPEAIECSDGLRRLKVGRPCDVWSLGCILYQMVYGAPPFQALSVYQKMRAIPDPNHVIHFPEHSAPSSSKSASKDNVEPRKWRVRRDVVACMKSCLSRNPKERMTIPELLDQEWLAMQEPEPSGPPSLGDISVKDLLGAKETIIDPHYMVQLLVYGIRLGQEGRYKIDTQEDRDALLPEGERLVQELKSLLQ